MTTKVTTKNREQIERIYIQTIMRSTPLSQLWDLLTDALSKNFATYSNYQLTLEIKESYPDILKETEINS